MIGLFLYSIQSVCLDDSSVLPLPWMGWLNFCPRQKLSPCPPNHSFRFASRWEQVNGQGWASVSTVGRGWEYTPRGTPMRLDEVKGMKSSEHQPHWGAARNHFSKRESPTFLPASHFIHRTSLAMNRTHTPGWGLNSVVESTRPQALGLILITTTAHTKLILLAL